MKRYISALLGLCCILVTATTGAAYTINSGSTDVGGLDTLLFSGDLSNSNPDTELAWAKLVLGTDDIFIESRTDFNGTGWAQTDTGNLFAFDLLGSPTWYLIKTGNLQNGTGNTDFLFQNNDSLNWAVVSLSDMGFLEKDILNVSKISHLTEFSNVPPVPEPGTIVLLSAGFLCLGLYGRRWMRMPF